MRGGAFILRVDRNGRTEAIFIFGDGLTVTGLNASISGFVTVTGDFGFDNADASHRGDNASKAAEPTLQNNDVSFKMLEDTADTNFLAIRTAALARTSLDLMFSTGGATTSGEHTIRGDFKVFGFKKGEPLNGINTWDVEMARCYSANPIIFTINS